MEPLPYDVIEAMVQCFGKSFHYKDPVAAFMTSNGVKPTLVNKYRHEAKFVWSRHVLSKLSETENGCLVQRRILTTLCQLRDLPDSGVENRNSGLDALRALKKLAFEQNLVAKEEKEKQENKARLSEERNRLVRERAAKLDNLRKAFNEALMNTNRQEAGYSLEKLLADLFGLFEIDYKKSYRTETQQIDGHFSFQSFDYLVEAKWRKDQPTESEIGAFRHKVKTKLESTRGLFVSIPGYRQEVIEEFNGHGANILLMDGEHLIHILEGRLDLRDALKIMIESAAQKGLVHTRFV